VTGGGSGIGAAICARFASEGAAVIVADLDREEAAAVAATVGGRGVALDVTDAAAVDVAIAGLDRLDVLVNSAGVGVGAPVDDMQTKRVDMQLDLNLRAIILFYRECVHLLRAAGAEHRNALVINLSSIAGKGGAGWLSVYAATKAAVIGWTQSMNKELAGDGIKNVALCPGFVDTPMTDFIREQVPSEQMIQPSDIAEAVRFLLRTSAWCRVPEIVFERPGEAL